MKHVLIRHVDLLEPRVLLELYKRDLTVERLDGGGELSVALGGERLWNWDQTEPNGCNCAYNRTTVEATKTRGGGSAQTSPRRDSLLGPW